ncbi:MAG: ammonium transporter [Phycisphaeraceae bacterium]
MRRTIARIGVLLPAVAAVGAASWAQAQESAAAAGPEVVEAAGPAISAADAVFTTHNLWIMLAGCLVFIMHLGFATLESGLTRAKNTVNILFKNTMVVCIGLLMYGLAGFALMYPGFADGTGYEVFGFGGWGITRAGPEFMSAEYADYTWYTDFFFQAMFAATAATIVSGAVAGRAKLAGFLVFTLFFVGLVYPVIGSWQWGMGWLYDLGFYDFAGSTLVHSVGGWGALMGAMILGPRLGKYGRDGATNAIPGHNMTLAAIGVFLLWFGWFGFNGGSVLSADPAGVSLVLVTTSMAAAAGGLVAAMVSWSFGGKPDITMALNGILAGLVGITAGADQMAVWESVAIGGIAGALVYFSVIFVDSILKVDDPVGAVSVHLVCGIWGTLAVGLFGARAGLSQLGVQAIGVLGAGAMAAGGAAVILYAVKWTLGLRVSEIEEIEGLDLGEHDMAAYPDFQQTYIKSYHAREI